MKALINIIIPTYNNREYLYPCLKSMLSCPLAHGLYNIIIVNNGHKDSCNWIENDGVTVLNTGKNLGWEGGLKEGLKHADAEFVMFANDDIFIPRSSQMWLSEMMGLFNNKNVGAVGPSSNVVMGLQNIWAETPIDIFTTKFLIGFCVLMRREALDKAGGVHTDLPGGDDFDYSIRLREAGYDLVVNKKVFVYHHGFKTGERVRGNASVNGGWNSWEYMQKVNTALIKKHGFITWYDTVVKGSYELPSLEERGLIRSDTEGDQIRKFVSKDASVIDLGVGASKTVKWAVGVDMIPKGEKIGSLDGAVSVADIVADVSKEIPLDGKTFDVVIARHILEHVIDPIKTLIAWRKALKDSGRLIIAVPDHGKGNTIPMNIEHVHAYTKENIKTFLQAAGFEPENIIDPQNGISFIVTAKKV